MNAEEVPVNIGLASRILEEYQGKRGHLAEILQDSEVVRLLSQSREFRDSVFLAIHQPLLTRPGTVPAESHGLYEHADFTSFLSALQPISPSAGEPSLSDYYTFLSNAVRSASDVNYWALKSGENMKDFQKALQFFYTSYSKSIKDSPEVVAVEKVYREALDTARKQKAAGFDPANYLRPNDKGISPWDLAVLVELKKVLPQKPSDPLNLRQKMYGTIAKAKLTSSLAVFEPPGSPAAGIT